MTTITTIGQRWRRMGTRTKSNLILEVKSTYGTCTDFHIVQIIENRTDNVYVGKIIHTCEQPSVYKGWEYLEGQDAIV
jgi:hypothetical protein